MYLLDSQRHVLVPSRSQPFISSFSSTFLHSYQEFGSLFQNDMMRARKAKENGAMLDALQNGVSGGIQGILRAGDRLYFRITLFYISGPRSTTLFLIRHRQVHVIQPRGR
jgi:hypothetical protein